GTYLAKITDAAARAHTAARPAHHHAQALLSAIPLPDPDSERQRERIILTGDVPSPADPPSGCRFRTRCWLKRQLDEAGTDTSACVDQEPLLQVRTASGADHPVACHFARTQSVV